MKNDKNNEDLDLKEYEKCLEKILTNAEKDYWSQLIDINRHQVGLAKTYLWIAVTLIAAFFAMYNKLVLDLFGIITLIFAITLAIFGFIVCLYSIPNRRGFQRVGAQSWGKFSFEAHSLLKERKKNFYFKFLLNFIDKFDKSSAKNETSNKKRGIKLRVTSWLLILSSVFGLISGVYSVIQNNNFKFRESFMSDNKKSNETKTTISKNHSEKPTQVKNKSSILPDTEPPTPPKRSADIITEGVEKKK